MKKFFLTLAATAMCATTFAAVGDETTILDQTFEEGTTLTDGSNYQWGSDIQGMINANGLYMTNDNNKDNGYDNRPFLTFPTKAPIGSETNEVNISYNLFCGKGKGQAATYFDINYFDANKKFFLGIRESIGDDWHYASSIITVDEEGNQTVTPLGVEHMAQTQTQPVSYTIKFVGNSAIIDIDGASYSTYVKKAGILDIKLSVTGGQDYSRGMNIKNFVIKTKEIEAVKVADYTLKYVCGSEVLKTVTKSGVVGSAIVVPDADKEVIWNEEKTVKYIFASDDVTGKTIAEDGSTVITLTYSIAPSLNYTVGNNVNDKTISGTCFEGDQVTVPFSKYALAANGVVWTKAAIDKQYNYTFTPDVNNFKAELEYTETEMTNGLLFIEAEKLTGLTEVTTNNANIRCSNAAAGYIEVAEGEEAAPVEICKLGKGTYTVETAVWGGKADSDSNITVVIKAGDKIVLSQTTTGSWTQKVSEEFTLDGETSLTVEGPIKNQPVDYFLVCGTTDQTPTAVEAIEAVKDGKWYNLQGVQVAEPTVKGLYIHNGKKVIVK